MDLLESLKAKAQKRKAHVGIGVNQNKDTKKLIYESATRATEKGYGTVEKYSSPKALVSAMKRGELDAIVRGTFCANKFIKELKQAFDLPQIYRAALINIDAAHSFFLAPVGIDEGFDIVQKLKIIKLSCKLLERLGLQPQIAILSGGRLEDTSRSKTIDESLQNGEELVKGVRALGFNAKHHGILIDEAYTQSNLIITPDGIIGNIVFRTLNFLGNCHSVGAPVLNMENAVIDTSRSKVDFSDSIMLASALTDQ